MKRQRTFELADLSSMDSGKYNHVTKILDHSEKTPTPMSQTPGTAPQIIYDFSSDNLSSIMAKDKESEPSAN